MSSPLLNESLSLGKVNSLPFLNYLVSVTVDRTAVTVELLVVLRVSSRGMPVTVERASNGRPHAAVAA